MPSSSPAGDLTLVRVAIEPLGRASPEVPLLEEALPALLAMRPAPVVVLDHAGPAAALWSVERPVGPTDVPEVRSGRRPRALDDAGWAALEGRYEAAARACASAGLPCALGVHDDGLLHAALSPRTWPEADDATRRALVSRMYRAASRGAAAGGGGPVDVVLVVEELCPGGLDPTDGIEMARALVGQGARRVFASAGTAALPALRRREKGSTSRGAHHALASAAWLVGRVAPANDVDVVALVPADEPGLSEAASALGLAGVIVEVA